MNFILTIQIKSRPGFGMHEYSAKMASESPQRKYRPPIRSSVPHATDPSRLHSPTDPPPPHLPPDQNLNTLKNKQMNKTLKIPKEKNHVIKEKLTMVGLMHRSTSSAVCCISVFDDIFIPGHICTFLCFCFVLFVFVLLDFTCKLFVLATVYTAWE